MTNTPTNTITNNNWLSWTMQKIEANRKEKNIKLKEKRDIFQQLLQLVIFLLKYVYFKLESGK